MCLCLCVCVCVCVCACMRACTQVYFPLKCCPPFTITTTSRHTHTMLSPLLWHCLDVTDFWKGSTWVHLPFLPVFQFLCVCGSLNELAPAATALPLWHFPSVSGTAPQAGMLMASTGSPPLQSQHPPALSLSLALSLALFLSLTHSLSVFPPAQWVASIWLGSEEPPNAPSLLRIPPRC